MKISRPKYLGSVRNSSAGADAPNKPLNSSMIQKTFFADLQ